MSRSRPTSPVRTDTISKIGGITSIGRSLIVIDPVVRATCFAALNELTLVAKSLVIRRGGRVDIVDPDRYLQTIRQRAALMTSYVRSVGDAYRANGSALPSETREPVRHTNPSGSRAAASRDSKA